MNEINKQWPSLKFDGLLITLLIIFINFNLITDKLSN